MVRRGTLCGLCGSVFLFSGQMRGRLKHRGTEARRHGERRKGREGKEKGKRMGGLRVLKVEASCIKAITCQMRYKKKSCSTLSRTSRDSELQRNCRSKCYWNRVSISLFQLLKLIMMVKPFSSSVGMHCALASK
jgi:hypothetical protein